MCRRPRSRPAGRRTCTPAPPATVPGRRRAEECCRRRSSRPALQTPTQLPAVQMFVQVVPRCQLPFASQVSGVFTSHRRSPGMQSVASRPTASTEPPPSFWVDPSGLLEPAVPGPPLAPTPPVPAAPVVPPRPPAAVPAAPADPEVPAVPAVPDAPASAPPVPAASLLSTALIDPHAAAHITGSSQATRVSSASRFVITKPTVEDRQPFIVRAGADLNAQIARMDGAVGLGSQVPDPARVSDEGVSYPVARQLPGRSQRPGDRVAARSSTPPVPCITPPTAAGASPGAPRLPVPVVPPRPAAPVPPRSAAPEPAISEPATPAAVHPSTPGVSPALLPAAKTTVSHSHSTLIRSLNIVVLDE